MGKAFIKEETLTDIGNAIRAKTGETAAMLPSAMAGAIENMKTSGGSGSYVWTKQGMGEGISESTSSGTYTLTTANNTKPSAEIEYSTTAPTYNNTKRQWIFADSTKMTLTNSDATLPSISGNVYCRDMSEPNVWYLVSAFSKGSSSPYLKSMTYSKKITAPVDWAKKYLTDADGEKYPTDGWLDGYYYKRTVADPNTTAANGKKWVLSFPLSVGFNDIVANGITNIDLRLWVASSSGNGLYYSTDGESWTQSNITSGDFNLVYHANGLWISGRYYSTDGKNWTQCNGVFGNFNNILFADNMWVGSTTSGQFNSTDGKNWSRPDDSWGGDLTAICYANGLWVAGLWNNNDYGGLHYSTTGVTWSDSNVIGNLYFDNIMYIYNFGIWVATQSSNEMGAYYSTDGKNWTKSNLNYYIGDICFADGLLVASANDGVYYSTDGKTWTKGSNFTNGHYLFKHIEYLNGVWVAGGSNGLYYSTNGKNWTQSNITDVSIRNVKCPLQTWMVAGKNGIYRSIGETVEVDF